MAREQGTFTQSANYELQKEGTIDARQFVDVFADLLNFTPSNYIAKGFPVTVREDSTFEGDTYKKGWYQFLGGALNDADNWEFMGGTGGIEPNEVIQIGLIEIIDDSGDKYLKIAETPNPKWRINGNVYTRTTESLTLIPFATTNKYRVDIFVGNMSSGIQRIEGVEDDNVGVPPAIPDNTVEITRVNIFGNEIGDPSSPPTGGFIKKLSKKYRVKNITNLASNVFFLDADNTTFLVQAGSESIINGFSMGIGTPETAMYDGMDIYINNKGSALTLKHNDGSINTPFWFANEVDFGLETNQIIHLKLNKTNNRVEMVGVASGGGGSSDLELGETETTAYRGDRGKIAYDHSQISGANPHGTTAAQVGAYTKAEVDVLIENKQRKITTSSELLDSDHDKTLIFDGTGITFTLKPVTASPPLRNKLEVFLWNKSKVSIVNFAHEALSGGWEVEGNMFLYPDQKALIIRDGSETKLTITGND